MALPISCVKIHMLDCHCADCEQPIVLASMTGWLKEYNIERVYRQYDCGYHVILRPQKYAPDTIIRVATRELDSEALPKLGIINPSVEFEVVLRTAVKNPPKDRRDIARFLATPADWKLHVENDERPWQASIPHWRIKLYGGRSVLNMTNIFTPDLDTVLKVCTRPLEVLFRYTKEPPAMKNQHTIEVQVRTDRDIKTVQGIIQEQLHNRLESGSDVQTRAVDSRPYAPTSWKEVFNGAYMTANGATHKTVHTHALNAGFTFYSVGDEVFVVDKSDRYIITPACSTKALP